MEENWTRFIWKFVGKFKISKQLFKTSQNGMACLGQHFSKEWNVLNGGGQENRFSPL